MQDPMPYCGSPPAPAELWIRWNLDPILIVALLAVLAAYAAGVRRASAAGAGEFPAWRRGAFYAGWAIGALAVTSPLCPLSVSLFAARIGQHMLLMLCAAPLVTMGRPVRAWRRLVFRQPTPSGRERPLLAASLFALALWYWHAPAPYVATFQSTLDYWLMHACLFLGAAWVWGHLLDRSPSAGSLGAAVLTMLQMGFLGALLVLAPRPLYPPHATTTAAWGLTPLQDQQIGGAIMWVPGGVIFMLAALLLGNALLRRGGFGVGSGLEPAR